MKYRLSIKSNHLPGGAPCTLCGQSVDIAVPLALFMADSFSPVCERCGTQHDPVLVQLLHLAYLAEELTFAMYPWLGTGDELKMPEGS